MCLLLYFFYAQAQMVTNATQFCSDLAVNGLCSLVWGSGNRRRRWGGKRKVIRLAVGGSFFDGRG
jgi:hypothetical protein